MNDADNESASHERQIYRPRRLLLARFSGDPTETTQFVEFRVETPDSRLHWKFDVIGIGKNNVPGAALLSGRGLKIWVAGLADDNVQGQKGTPVTDIQGTRATPSNFPADQTGAYDVNLGGYSLENSGTAADAIQGRITIPAQGGGPEGALWLQCRYQPNVGSFIPWGEWEEIKALCGPSLLTGKVDT